MQSRRLQNLRLVLIKEYQAIPQDIISNFINLMPLRVQAVVAATLS